jgi:sigma-E factor negative regulatory protein RseC
VIEEIGTITAVEHSNNRQQIWVETQIKTTCGGCQANDDCGTGIVARAFSPKKEQLILDCDQTVKVGQQVKLGIPEERLLSASALVYLLPLVCMACAALFAQFALTSVGIQGEGWVILSALISAIFSFYAVSQYLKKDKQADYQPQLLGLLPWQGEAIEFVSLDDSANNNPS